MLITGNALEEVGESSLSTSGKSSGYKDETTGEIIQEEYRKNTEKIQKIIT